MWHAHMVFKGYKEVNPVVQREIKKAEAKAQQREETGWDSHRKGLSFSLCGPVHNADTLAQLPSALLKVSDRIRNLTLLVDIKHPASLWSCPDANSWALCFSVLLFTTFYERSQFASDTRLPIPQRKEVGGWKQSLFLLSECKKDLPSLLLWDTCVGIFDSWVCCSHRPVCLAHQVFNIQ